jgi:hypothetical protein
MQWAARVRRFLCATWRARVSWKRGSPAVLQRFENRVMHAAALDHVLSKVALTFE